MQTFSKLLRYPIKTIAFVDSLEGGAESMLPYWDAEIAGYAVVHIPEHIQRLHEVVAFIQEHAQAVVCTHRLGYPLFSGAELAAALYDIGIPTVVVTQYLEIDQHSSLRLWRAKLPAVLDFREFDSDSLTKYLDLCVAELQGRVPKERLPYRVMVGVEDIECVGNTHYIDASIEYWDRYTRIRFPLDLMPAHLQASIAQDSWFFALVNIHAQYADELYFRDFVPAPAPDSDENMNYCMNVFYDSMSCDAPLLWFILEWWPEHEKNLAVEHFEMQKDIYN